MITPRLHQVLQRSEGVKTGKQRGWKSVAQGIEPDRGRTREDADAVVRPDRFPVLEPFGVVPHPVAVDEVGARTLRNHQHPAVHMRRNAAEHLTRRPTQPRRPHLANQVVVAANPSRGDDHRLRPQRELTDRDARAGAAPLDSAGFKHHPLDAIDSSSAKRKSVDSVSKPERHGSARRRLPHPALEWRNYRRAGPPGDVKARDRVARTARAIPAALGPTNDREKSNTLLTQPRPLLASGKSHVSLSPSAWPLVVLPVEAGGAQPVRQRPLDRVVNPEPPLLG